MKKLDKDSTTECENCGAILKTEKRLQTDRFDSWYEWEFEPHDVTQCIRELRKQINRLQLKE